MIDYGMDDEHVDEILVLVAIGWTSALAEI